MKKALIVDCGNYNSVTTVQINYIKCLLKEGYHINYIIFKDCNEIDEIKHKRWPNSEKITYIEIDSSSITTKLASRLFGKSLVNLVFLIKYLKLTKHVICVDYYSALPVYLFSLMNPNFSYQIASLELFNNNSFLVRKAMQCSKLVTTQDELRKGQIIKYYKIPNSENVQVLYNTSLSWEEITNEKVKLPKEIDGQKIILFIGSLISEHCIEEVIEWVEIIDDNYCIIFHGWGISQLNQMKIEILKSKYPKKVWLSNIALGEAEKWKMYNVADIGLVMFDQFHRNNLFAGLSAGKLFDFVRVGVPLIVTQSDLLKEFVVENALGKLYENRGKLLQQLKELEDFDKTGMSEKFIKLSFTTNFYKVIEIIS